MWDVAPSVVCDLWPEIDHCKYSMIGEGIQIGEGLKSLLHGRSILECEKRAEMAMWGLDVGPDAEATCCILERPWLN